jgi:hypothetical protein
METLQNNFSKNQLQLYFNQVKGEIIEIVYDEKYSNLTIRVGHENSRLVNFVAKSPFFKDIVKDFQIGDKIIAKYYISSKKKNERYYTTASLLDVQKITSYH